MWIPLLALSLGCSGASEPSGPEAKAPNQSIVLALNWLPEPEFGGFYEGMLGGHYAEAGFDVQILPGGAGAPSLELMASGKADAAITAADDLLLKRNKGVKALGVWPAFQRAPNGLMVRETGPQGFGAILPGTQVAIEVGSPFQRYLWEKQGWGTQVQAVPYTGGIGQFLADEDLIQQAYITSEVCMAQAKGVDVRFLKAADAGWNPYGTLLALPDPMPSWGPAFVEATEKAWEAYMANPQTANAHMASLNPALTDEVLSCVTQAQAEYVLGEQGLGHMDAARWDAMAETLVDLGLLPEGSSAQGAWVVVE